MSRRTAKSHDYRRSAAHAGSWYTDDGEELDTQLTSWLDAVKDTQNRMYPVKGCKAIISPHAGYTYSGPAAAYAYKSIDTIGITRVFVLGPSHHVYINGCALSPARVCETPVGDLEVDLEVIDQLRQTGEFEKVSIDDDEAEHSLEMQLPYVRKVFQGQPIKIIPIIVGSISQASEKHYGQILAPYLSKRDTMCVVSSDFCHWGTRFSYTFYYPVLPSTTTPTTAHQASESDEQDYDKGISLSRSTSTDVYASSDSVPIYQSIEALDKQGMGVLSIDPKQAKSATEAHDAFARYLKKTKNTICGRHPIGVLLGALSALQSPSGSSGVPSSSDSGAPSEDVKVEVKFVRYEQSSQCANLRDSSVSYASAWVRF